MKTESAILINSSSSLKILTLILVLVQCSASWASYFDPAYYDPKLDPSQQLTESESLVNVEWPEYYIDTTMDQGINLVIPSQFRSGLQLDTGYDRWEGLPTLQADYFLPLKGWSDKSIFFAPRVSLTGDRESYAFGVGFRHLIDSDTLIGFHAFHDWVRPRGSKGSFLKEAGVGLEFSTLPGNFSDLSLSVNVYVPTNERRWAAHQGRAVVKETMPYGVDARIGLLLPPLIDILDIRLDAQAHTYQADQTSLWGYKTGLTVSSRDGMFNGTVERDMNSAGGDNLRLQGNVTLVFDWLALFEGRMPLSVPYQASEVRYSRQLSDSLDERVVRQHDLPTDRSERPITLAAAIIDDTVSFRGDFPDVADSPVTVQVSQSPWRDVLSITTDSTGSYSGSLTLPPGEYHLRLIHKPTGLVTGVTRIVIEEE